MSLFNSYPIRESFHVLARSGTPYPFARMYFSPNTSSVNVKLVVINMGENAVTIQPQVANRTDKVSSEVDDWDDNGTFANVSVTTYAISPGGETNISLDLKRYNLLQFVTTTTDGEATNLLFQGVSSADYQWLLAQEPDLARETLGVSGFDSTTPSITVTMPQGVSNPQVYDSVYTYAASNIKTITHYSSGAVEVGVTTYVYNPEPPVAPNADVVSITFNPS